jgi:hypothetical protein
MRYLHNVQRAISPVIAWNVGPFRVDVDEVRPATRPVWLRRRVSQPIPRYSDFLCLAPVQRHFDRDAVPGDPQDFDEDGVAVPLGLLQPARISHDGLADGEHWRLLDQYGQISGSITSATHATIMGTMTL